MARLTHAVVLVALTVASASPATPTRPPRYITRGPKPNHIDKDEFGLIPKGDTQMNYLWSKVRSTCCPPPVSPPSCFPGSCQRPNMPVGCTRTTVMRMIVSSYACMYVLQGECSGFVRDVTSYSEYGFPQSCNVCVVMFVCDMD